MGYSLSVLIEGLIMIELLFYIIILLALLVLLVLDVMKTALTNFKVKYYEYLLRNSNIDISHIENITFLQAWKKYGQKQYLKNK